eukprot:1169200_1
MPSLSSSQTNKICEWIIIIICASLSGYFSRSAITIDNQWDASDAPEPAPDDVPCRTNTIDFYLLNFISPLIWFLLVGINISIISRYHGCHNDTMIKSLLKAEILLRSVAMSVVWTYVTTEAIKCYVPRKRPCYHAMVAEYGNRINAMKSFPSGHTSYSFSVFFILTLYLMNSLMNSRQIIKDIARADHDQTRLRMDLEGDRPQNPRLRMDKVITVSNGDSYLCLRFFLWFKGCQIIGLLFAMCPTVIALVIGCTRITDFRHRYSDVFVGAFIGILFSSLSFAYYRSEFYDGYQYDTNKIFIDEDEQTSEPA